MATAEAAYSLTQGAYERDYGDEKLFVKFFFHPKHNKKKSVEEGRPIFDDTEYVEIQIPGDKDNIVRRPASTKDKERFPKHYAAFKNKGEEALVGTPLSAVPWITQGGVEELKHFGVHTVEQLAGITDANAQNFRGVNTLRDQAKTFLEAAAGNAPLIQMQAELEDRDKKISALEIKIENLIDSKPKGKAKL